MKELDWPKTLIIFIGLIVAGYFVGNMHKTGLQYDRYVQVKGLSEREVEADMAVWPINITLTGNDLNVLKNSIEAQNEAVYSFFIQQGFDASEITRGTTNISDARANLYNSGNQSPYRFIAVSEFTVRTQDIPRLKNALAESLSLMSEGIILGSKNTWRPVEYIFTGLNTLKPEMIEEATKNAREVAIKFAEDSKSSVGKIKVARQGLFTINDRDQNTPEIKIVRVVSTLDFHLQD